MFDELTGPKTAFLVRRCKTSLKVRPLVIPSSSSSSSTSSSALSLATKGSIAHQTKVCPPKTGQGKKLPSLKEEFHNCVLRKQTRNKCEAGCKWWVGVWVTRPVEISPPPPTSPDLPAQQHHKFTTCQIHRLAPSPSPDRVTGVCSRIVSSQSSDH